MFGDIAEDHGLSMQSISKKARSDSGIRASEAGQYRRVVPKTLCRESKISVSIRVSDTVRQQSNRERQNFPPRSSPVLEPCGRQLILLSHMRDGTKPITMDETRSNRDFLKGTEGSRRILAPHIFRG